MALIGTMKYLTIGNQTYEIAVDELQIASASTLGGIKVGNGLSINATTGVLSASITETDPVFSASAAAGITSTDISNWNAKVSDDHKWAAVTLGNGRKDDTSDLWIPCKTDNHNISGTAYWIKTTQELPTSAAVEYVQIPRYKKINGSWYLQSTTPSVNDNSTKVATTAYVDAAIPDTSSFSTTDEKVKATSLSADGFFYPVFGSNSNNSETKNYIDSFKIGYSDSVSLLSLYLGSSTTESRILLYNGIDDDTYTIVEPSSGYRVLLKLPSRSGTIALTSDIPSVYSSTNTGGYLTMATLPIYDGTVI